MIVALVRYFDLRKRQLAIEYLRRFAVLTLIVLVPRGMERTDDTNRSGVVTMVTSAAKGIFEVTLLESVG